MHRLRRGLACMFLASSALVMVACGGASSSGHRDDGRAGSAGAASAGSGSGGASSERKGCVYAGQTYADGAMFQSTDGCHYCACSDGEVACDDGACASGCLWEGRHYEPGESFPAADGCNNCSCGLGGEVACTLLGCPTCDDLQTLYDSALEGAKACDPKQSKTQCTVLLGGALTCGCAVFVNPDNVDALSTAKEIQAGRPAAMCGLDVMCGQCAQASKGYCSSEGRCETLWEHGGAACQIGGVIYPDGARDIPDPVSCNKCTCQDGQLGCTEINCPVACPPDSVYGTQCADCGPTDACLVVEHACLPVCSPGSDSCNGGSCLDGVCRKVCG